MSSIRLGLKETYEPADIIDIQHLSEFYFRGYLKLDPAEADRVAEEIRPLAPIRSGKDRKIIVH